MSLFTGVVLLGVVLAALTIGIWWKKTNVVEMLAFGVIYWLCAWVVTAMGFFVLDVFSLLPCAVGTVVLELAVGAAALIVRKKRDKTPWRELMTVSWDIRPYWLPILVCAGGFVLVAMKHELFGMGQDEGVYQTVAINFLNGVTDRQQDFPEYHTLSEAQQETFRNSVHSYLVGYDIGSRAYPDTVYDLSVSPVSGIYHGIPTYASLLAMWGKLFGMAQMQDVQTVFYGCTIFLVFFLCRNLKLRRSSTALACAAAAASPVVIWVAKSALTEGFLSVLMVLFLYFLTDEEHPRRQWMSILPVVVFSCFHVSIYTILPLFVVLYGGMFWLTRRKSFAILMPLLVVIYCISFFAMRHVQPFYTMNNYSPLFGLGISQADLPTLIPAVCAGALVLIGLYLFLMHRLVHRKYRDITPENYLLRVQDSRLGFLLVELLLVPLVIYIVLKCVTAEEPLAKLQGSDFWGFICGTGLLLLPLAWGMGIVRPKFYLESAKRLVVLVAAFYCVLFYSAFLRFDVEYYYYYGRYLVPFLPIAVVFGAMTIDRLCARVTLPVMAAGLLFVSPYDRFLMNHVDDTRLQWSVLEDVASEIGENDCVIVDSENMWTMYLPLRAMTGADAYPVMADPQTQAEQLQEKYDHVFYLGSGSWNDTFDQQFRLVYANTAECSTDENYTNRGSQVVMFPLEYSESSRTVSLYEFWQEELSYAAADCAGTEYRGFYTLEGEFCWAYSTNAAVRCNLEKQDYTMIVSLGCTIPLKEIGQETYPVIVLVNGENAGTMVIDDTNNGQSVSLDISGDLLNEGANVITLQSELWSASTVNPADVRLLGIPLKNLEFAAA